MTPRNAHQQSSETAHPSSTQHEGHVESTHVENRAADAAQLPEPTSALEPPIESHQQLEVPAIEENLADGSVEGPSESVEDIDEPIDAQSIARNAFAQLGALLLDAGYAVTDVHFSLGKVARKTGHPEMSFAVLPATVLVSDFPGRPATVVNAEGRELPFWTSARVNGLVRELATGSVPVSEFADRVYRMRTTVRPVAGWELVLGSALLATGLAAVYRVPWWAILSTFIIGGVIGLVIHMSNRIAGAGTIVNFVIGFCSTAAVGILADTFNLGPIPLFAVCAPLVVLVPGATITNALLELSSTDMVTGSSRLMYGLLVLGFMTTGIGAAAMVTGLTIDRSGAALLGEVGLVNSEHSGWYGIPPSWVTWVGVIGIALGISLAFKAGPLLTVLGVPALVITYAGTVWLSPYIGGIAATGVVGAAIFFAARTLEWFVPRAPAIVTFRPVFLLLVPGTVGLVALTTFNDQAMLDALGTFLSLSIGTKIGAVVADLVFRGESQRD